MTKKRKFDLKSACELTKVAILFLMLFGLIASFVTNFEFVDKLVSKEGLLIQVFYIVFFFIAGGIR